ncbi:MAG TPA: PP2C family protein-serine/threonine phosphatase [Candidatus Eisenbacteria bacterium]|nr:PP2C family protein-serine/threonine phosphatase [Candidatus Eisenbacteria bacterium]
MSRKPTPPTAGRDFVRLLWQQPLVAIPFAIFFSVLFGGFPRAIWGSFQISLVFSGVIGVVIWAVRWFVLKNHVGLDHWWKAAAWYSVGSTSASLLSALIIHYTFRPGFLGSGSDVVLILMFALLFGALFMGIGMAMSFYKDAVERVKSDQELNLARRIQRSFLMESFPRRPRIEIHATNVSSRHVSGDFYDVVPVADEGLLLAVADVSGKGVPAALLSSMLQASVRTQAGSEPSVSAMMGKINALVCQRVATGQFATFFLAWIDERRMRLLYTNAGHNQPIHLGGFGRRLLDVGGTVVGMLEGLTWDQAELPLQPGDRLVLYTDGVTEAMNESGDMFGEERLYELIDRLSPALSAEGIVDGVLEGLRDFLGDLEAGDDVTVMAVRVLDPATATDGAKS